MPLSDYSIQCGTCAKRGTGTGAKDGWSFSVLQRRGRGDRSAIDSESLLGCAVVTPLLNVALCVLPVDLL